MNKICCEPFFVFSREKIDLGSKVGQIPDKSGKNFTALPQKKHWRPYAYAKIHKLEYI